MRLSSFRILIVATTLLVPDVGLAKMTQTFELYGAKDEADIRMFAAKGINQVLVDRPWLHKEASSLGMGVVLGNWWNIETPWAEIERTLDYLRTYPLVPIAAMKDGLGRKDEPAYSLRALQEAVVNALVHRNYSIHGAQVRAFLFPNRIEISNPGRLHNTLTRDDLFAGCQPVRRNQMLAGFLRDYESPVTGRAYMEGRGEGFLTMVRECQHVSGRPPELYIVGDSVKLVIYARPEILASEVGVTQ